MANKTCGECRFYAKKTEHCKLKGIGWKFATDTPCSGFTPRKSITNRDVFLAKRSDEELAGDYTQFWNGNGMWCAILCRTWYETKAEALQANLKWLNAPAENEGEDEQP